MQKFIFFTTSGCHLCQLAEDLMVVHLDSEMHQVDVLDIAYDDQLLELYGERIPVLKNELTGRELGWPFDAEGLILFIKN